MFFTELPWKKIGIFAGGVLFGTAGFKILGSSDAKKVYTDATAALLRGQDCVMKISTNVKENCEDIFADAKRINEKRAEAEENAAISDSCECDGKEV